ncbi:DUF4426 domain-containing protein [Halopseudomonas nanhaiensis]|uniref:DUF4426 domain-containing protein n=1 Tax=Halopseudomonas nanhaiensis TaxID=2830842 RepID=UPI001CBDC440|nr:DUF4426 domain-containing protein [Halopseudomonas nanhaiensis]UAW98255.1 DUF4426 domain-containing protein [Halopseudomonas nanhaiensis]
MLRKMIGCLLLLASATVLGQAQSNPQRFGDLLVHYNLLNSSYLEPEIAANAGLSRGPTHGVITLLVQRDTREGKIPVDARVSGTVSNLLQQSAPIEFIRIQEDEAIYFVANYTAAQRGVLRFEVNVQAEKGAPVHTLRFQQEFHPDE